MDNTGKKSGKLINWITVWGFIFGCIAFNQYIDYQQQRKWYHAQYKAESRRADSLLVEKNRLEQRLREVEGTSNQTVSAVRHGEAKPAGTVGKAL